MALRSGTRTATTTSGPGRGPRSDGRSRHRRPSVTRGRGQGRGHGQGQSQGRVRHRHAASADELRRRAEVLFAERAGERRNSGKGPPGGEEAGVAEEIPLGEQVAGATEELLPEELLADGVPHSLPQDVSHGVPHDLRHGAPDDVPLGGSWGEAADRPGVWRERAGAALRERMPVWLQARCGLERRNVVALSVLLVVAAVFALQHFWTGRTQSVQAPEVVRAAAPFGDSGADSGRTGADGRQEAAGAAVPGGSSGTTGSPGAEIVVDVSGKVREPGIQRLPAGSRVADALKAAGGVRPGTNTDTLNRARFLVDGEQVVVGGPAAPAPAPVPGVGGSVAGGPAGTATAPVSLNTATVDQLDTLPGVGPVLAQHIVDYRTRHGGFRSVNELREVNGIGDRRFADLRNLVQP
ncbi:ComEA family DNA-binding protein [Streptomyces sp. NPDC093990]|uniref:ComEA family DNA-binding protein n=1 Tax=Streptomyces sp. NPDC093990 TaxID=3155306 RepID=UPI0034258590